MSAHTADPEAARRPTVLDLQAPTDRASKLIRLPSLVVDALCVVWAAGKRQLVVAALLQVVGAVTVGVQLLVSREIFRGLVAAQHGGALSQIYPWLLVIAALGGLTTVVGAILVYQQKLLAELTAQHAFGGILDVAAEVELASFETPRFYDQLERARYSGTYRTMEMVNSVLALTTGLLTSLGIAAALFILQPLLLVFVALAATFPLLAAIHNGRRAYTFEYALTPENRERLYVFELLTEREPAKEVRVYGAAPFLRGRWNALSAERLRRLRSFLALRLRVSLIGSGAGIAGMFVAVGALIFLLSNGRMHVATALTAGLAMQQLGSRLSSLTASAGSLIEAGMFLDDYQAFLELAATESHSQPADRTLPAAPFGGLSVEGLSFAYPGSRALALDDVSLRVDPGEVVAIVGANGSGKTTLVKLICQLYRPDAGTIRWSGIDAGSLSAEAVREDITVLFQDYLHYAMSARDNIVIGRPECAEDERAVVAAAERAGAAGFVSSLPHGYETRLGPQFFGGQELSVGQWQRMALARAFFRGGSFVILDEPTASLDPRAEAELFAQMKELAGGRSVLLVSHRFSSVLSADRIYVVDNGRIVESGSHAALLANDALYAELFNLQAEAYLAAAPA